MKHVACEKGEKITRVNNEECRAKIEKILDEGQKHRAYHHIVKEHRNENHDNKLWEEKVFFPTMNKYPN